MLLIDETSIRKRHRYVTVVVNGDTGEVLAMVQGRSKQALNRFFVANHMGSLSSRAVSCCLSVAVESYDEDSLDS